MMLGGCAPGLVAEGRAVKVDGKGGWPVCPGARGREGKEDGKDRKNLKAGMRRLGVGSQGSGQVPLQEPPGAQVRAGPPGRFVVTSDCPPRCAATKPLLLRIRPSTSSWLSAGDPLFLLYYPIKEHRCQHCALYLEISEFRHLGRGAGPHIHPGLLSRCPYML